MGTSYKLMKLSKEKTKALRGFNLEKLQPYLDKEYSDSKYIHALSLLEEYGADKYYLLGKIEGKLNELWGRKFSLPLFKDKKLEDVCCDSSAIILKGKDAFKRIIEVYYEDGVKYMGSLLKDDIELAKEGDIDAQWAVEGNRVRTKEQKCFYHIHDFKRMLDGGIEYLVDLDLSKDRITTSSGYLFQIFELTRLYKLFDFDNYDLVLTYS